MNLRIIARLDVKPPYVVKPICYEGLKKIGTPQNLSEKYFIDGADEIIYTDIVASLYQREILYEEIKKCAQNIFIPLCAGGGVKTLEHFSKLFHNGADKVHINTFALQDDPSIINQASNIFGSQSVVVSIEAKRISNDKWICYSDCGRIPSQKDVIDWVKEVERRGAGEIIINSVDSDGLMKGFDFSLVKNVVENCSIPVVAASGAGSLSDLKIVSKTKGLSGIAIGSILHYNHTSISEIKAYLEEE